jgi:predicted PurR-regulated permease PerM
MKEDPKLNSTIHYATEVAIRLGFLILLLAWCFQIIYPFGGIIMWGIILSLATAPLYDTLNSKLGNRPKLASAIIIISGLLIIIIPSWLFFDSIISGIKMLNESLNEGTLTIPPPPEKVAEWPIIGDQIYEIWKFTSSNLEAAIVKYKDQITVVASSLFDGVLSMGGSILQFVFATIIAGILLATKGTDQTARKFFKRIKPPKIRDLWIANYLFLFIKRK